MTAHEARELDWLTQREEKRVGYFIEGSILYPVELHAA